MRIEVKVPQLPESVAEATLLTWHKKAGDAVSRDENLIDIETDKVVLELPAPSDGVLVEVTRPDGATVTSNDLIAVIDTEARAAAASPAAPSPIAASSAAPSPVVASAAVAAGMKPAPAASALPAARKMIADQGLDAGTIAGSGRGGRITKGDVIAAAAAAPAAAASAPPPAARAPAP
ncbi:MAG: E3 binding domain-containing protein, partial [Betaproteobacteria bacterium]|nr:E3 binding domain-containing protein [Betaproteobacteria bacterium]